MPLIQIPTQTGSSVSASTSSDLQTAFVQEFVAIAAALPASTQTVYTPGAAHDTFLLKTPDLIDLPQGVDTIEGTVAIPTAQILLAGSGAVYVTDYTTVSTVVATDNSTSTIINNNPGAALIAVTGAGNNTVEALAGANVFVTGNGGTDNVTLNGFYNNLTSNGTDQVSVGGASTITAAGNGVDTIQLTIGSLLGFINGSASATPSQINGNPNAIVDLVGPGNTSITAGNGPEYYFVDTSAGNVTLNANPGAFTALTLIKDAPHATANIQIQNLSSNDYVAIHGYTGETVVASGTVPNSAVLLLSDGSQVTFVGVSVQQVQVGVHQV